MEREQLWKCVIEPLLRAAQPDSIIHVGSDRSGVLAKIVDHGTTGATKPEVHWVLPADAGSDETLEAGGGVTTHRGLSLNALARIAPADLVLLDSDPNWYTAYNELMLLERGAREAARPFPLTVIRRVGWPFGRRDAYHDPQAIPDLYRRPTAEKTQSAREISGPATATEDSGAQNGVLSAIEDFLLDTDLSLKFVSLAGFEGVGILYPSTSDTTAAVDKVLAGLAPQTHLAGWIEGLENSRIDATRKLASTERRLDRFRERVRGRFSSARNTVLASRSDCVARDAEIARLEDLLTRTTERVEQAEKALAHERTRHEELQAAWARERDCLQDDLDTQRFEMKAMLEDWDIYEGELEEREGEIQQLRHLVQEGNQSMSHLRQRLETMERGLARLLETNVGPDGGRTGKSSGSTTAPDPADGEALVNRLETLLQEHDAALSTHGVQWSILNSDLRQVDGNLTELVDWFDKLEGSLKRMFSSRRWRIASKMGAAQERLLRRDPYGHPRASIESVLNDYRQWRETHVAGIHVVRLATHPSADAETAAAEAAAAGSNVLDGNPADGNASATVRPGVALFEPDTRRLMVRYSLTEGPSQDSFRIDAAPENGAPLLGRWEAGAQPSLGYFDAVESTFHIKRTPGGGAMDLSVRFGPREQRCIPVVGDWNGDGCETIGIFDPATARFHLRNSLSAGTADIEFRFGPRNAGWIPIVGDWTGDGVDRIGLYDPERSRFHLRFLLREGQPDARFTFGPTDAGMVPISGSWHRNGHDGIGLFDPATSEFSLRTELDSGKADTTFRFAVPEGHWLPLTGQWRS